MVTEVTRTLDAFEALRTEWNDLVAAMERPEIFYRWEWHWFYYRHCRNGAPLFIVTVREGGKLVGLAPMCVTERRALGQRVRVMEHIVGNMSDYRNWLVSAALNRWRTAQAMLELVNQHGADWDVLDLRQLPSQDATVFQLANMVGELPDLRHGLRIESRTSRLYYGGDYRSKMDLKRIHRIKNKRTQLGKERALVCRVGEADSEEFWSAFLTLHRTRWPDSPLHRPEGRRLFADLRAHFAERGELECSWLTLDGRMAAMHFGFRDRRKVYYYMPVLAEEFKPERVGNILTLSMVEHYASTHQEFDFLRGDESYKLWWTDDVAVNYRLRIYRRSNLAAVADGLVPATKEYIRALEFPRYLAGRLRTLLKGSHERVA